MQRLPSSHSPGPETNADSCRQEDSLDLLLSQVADALEETQPTLPSDHQSQVGEQITQIQQKIARLKEQSQTPSHFTALSASEGVDPDGDTPCLALHNDPTKASDLSVNRDASPRPAAQAAARLPLAPGADVRSQIEGYDIHGEIGRGGMGSVWRARERATGRRVAIKFLDGNRLTSEVARGRFEREVRLAARLEHPYIARIYGTGLSDACYFYVMELIDGVPLDQHVRRYKLSLEDTLVLLHRICMAVEYAHGQGIIHRDLKPSNILITRDGEPRIVDFGLAKIFSDTGDGDPDPTLSVEGHVAGSPGYMAPEQAAGKVRMVDQRTDVYALGAILFKLLTGQHPHDQTGPLYEVVRRIIDEPVRSPRKLNPRIDREFEAMLLTALSTDQDDRYSSAAAFAQDLLRYINGEKLSVQSSMTTYWRRAAKKHWQKAAVAAALLAFHATIGLVVGQMIYTDAQQDAEQLAQRERLEQRLDSLYAALRRYDHTRGPGGMHARTANMRLSETSPATDASAPLEGDRQSAQASQ